MYFFICLKFSGLNEILTESPGNAGVRKSGREVIGGKYPDITKAPPQVFMTRGGALSVVSGNQASVSDIL